MRSQQHQTRQVQQQCHTSLANPLLRLWEYAAEMQEQRGSQEPSHQVPQVHDLIEIVQLARIVESEQDKAGHTQDEKVLGARSASPPEIHEQTDGQVNRT